MDDVVEMLDGWRAVAGSDAWCRDLPARSFPDFVAGRLPMLFVLPSAAGIFVIEDEDGIKLGSYLSVREAQSAGDGIAASMRPEAELAMVRAEGLNIDEWAVVCRDNAAVLVNNKETRTLVPKRRDDGTMAWHAMGVIEDLGLFSSASDAASTPEVHLDEEGVPHSS